MGDLQAQLEEMRRLWEEESAGRKKVEAELTVLKGAIQFGANGGGTSVATTPTGTSAQGGEIGEEGKPEDATKETGKRGREENDSEEMKDKGDAGSPVDDEERSKRARVE